MIRKTMIAASLILISGGLAGTAFSQINKPLTVSTAKPAEMSPAWCSTRGSTGWRRTSAR